MTDTGSRRRFLRTASLAALAPASLVGRASGDSAGEANGAAAGGGRDDETGPSSGEGSERSENGVGTGRADGDLPPAVRERARRAAHEVRRSVVKLTAGDAVATGWVVDDGHVVTNAHVVAETGRFDVETFDGRSGTAVRVGYRAGRVPDVALLETDLDAPPPLPTTARASVSRDDPVLVVGHPHGVGDWVASLGRYVDYEERTGWLLADVPVASGSSGSPLATLDGDVVGCVKGTTGRDDERERLDRPAAVYESFPRGRLTTAVPAETVRRWTSRWLNGERATGASRA
ncbi:S1 family peptidase [Halomicrococcus gelatinilyticus]|uniref:S1 family peptidase n=1 Tax=Halomicrococcus gelatinilyticus TaxID=1702103 RepID=UPI002E140AC3